MMFFIVNQHTMYCINSNVFPRCWSCSKLEERTKTRCKLMILPILCLFGQTKTRSDEVIEDTTKTAVDYQKR